MTPISPATNPREIAELVGGTLDGPGELELTALAALDAAEPGCLSFVGEASYAAAWGASRASAALVVNDLEIAPGDRRALIRVDNADLAMARVLERYARPEPGPDPGIHRTAVVADDVEIPDDARIGPHCVVEPGVTLGRGVTLFAGVYLGHGVALGDHCTLHPHAVVRHGCSLGDRCILHAGCVIGGDGFGYRPEHTDQGPRIVKITHLGAVRVGHDVEIGCNACVDRGKFNDTVIGDGCKLDNLVQIGHNCTLGRMVLIAGGTGIAGTTTLDDGAMIGGMVACKDHVRIGKGARLAGGAQVAGNVPDGETYGGSPARPLRDAIREVTALKKLPDALKRMARAERRDPLA